MKKAILFDADGVVILPNKFREVLMQHGISPTQTRAFFGKEYQKCLIGKQTLKSCLPRHLKKWGWTKSYNDFIKLWLNSDSNLNTKLLEKISNLRRKGIKCYLATNQEHNRKRHLKLLLKNKFDGQFFSCELKKKKPNLNYFLAVKQKLKNHEIHFFDDKQENVKSAAKTGIKSHLYTCLGSLKEIK